MFGSIFKRRARTSEKALPKIPDGARLYVIGDIHGRLDLLQRLADKIDKELALSPVAMAHTIFLGDYVDRGPHSAGVLESLSKAQFPTDAIALRGNHEEVMLKFLDDETVLDSWRKFGGLETLHSYGVDVSAAMRGAGYDSARQSLIERMSPEHVEFLKQTRLSVDYGDYFFCHAGVRPGVPLEAQTADDLLWIREEFLRHEGSHGKVIVHGHTPVAAPEIHASRINVDTGAYASSILTALVLEGDTQRFLNTARR